MHRTPEQFRNLKLKGLEKESLLGVRKTQEPEILKAGKHNPNAS
jgi:hypothetical protein